MFLHDAVLESVLYGETEISAPNLYAALGKLHRVVQGKGITGYQKQFKVHSVLSF